MSRMEVLGRRMRGSSSGACPRLCGARTYFYFNRFRVLARMHAVARPVGKSSVKGYLPKAGRNDLAFFTKLIGKEFALALFQANERKIRIERKDGQLFNFYAGVTSRGKKVALLEVF